MKKVYKNKRGFEYIILRKICHIKGSNKRSVIVQFSDGYEREADYSSALSGSVRHDAHDLKVGYEFTSNQGCNFVIIERKSAAKIKVRATDGSGFTTWTAGREIRKGAVKNLLFKEVLGIGYMGVGVYQSQEYDTSGKKRNTDAYEVWRGMMRRCYDENYQRDKAPAYKGCFVNPVWCNFQNFAYWFYNHPYRQKGWHLDKDIISRGNKEYSPLLCTFIPTQINSATTNTKAKRGSYPVGVYLRTCNGKFRAQLATYGSAQKMLIETTDLKLAFNTYKEAKEKYLRELADSYRDRIDPLVYKGLYNWTVSEDD